MACVTGLVVGLHSKPVAPVYAACGSANGVICGRAKASLVEVDHENVDPTSLLPRVEPDSGETFSVTAYWATSTGGSCACTETSATATVRVDWDQANDEWDIACTSGCDAFGGPMFSFDICDDDRCVHSSGDRHSWKYIIEGEIAQTRSICDPSRQAYLNRVVYTTTSVDDGDVIDDDCAEAGTVQPTSQTFSVTDTGANQPGGTFVCFPSDCDGPTLLTITYD